MRIPALSLLLLLAAAPARAGESDGAPRPDAGASLPDLPVTRSTPGWTKQAKSLLLYDEGGNLVSEVGLVAGEEAAGRVREVLGGVSPDGRAAWTLERSLLWSAGRTKLLDSRRSFRVYGSQGQTLWQDDLVDLPESGEPAAFSSDAKVILTAMRGGEAWSVEARDWTGLSLQKAGAFPRLHSIHLTPSGRYAMARWVDPDKSATHTFLDLKTGKRRDVASSSLTLGMARIGDDGAVRSGTRLIFSFDASTAAVRAASPPPEDEP